MTRRWRLKSSRLFVLPAGQRSSKRRRRIWGAIPKRCGESRRKTELHIIMGAGWYRQPFYPPEVDRLPTNQLAEMMIRDLTVGVGETGIRAGIIGEIGIDLDYATAQEERVLRAAARAHKATGAPITTHASMYPVGLAQLEILKDEGRRSKPRHHRSLRHLSRPGIPSGDT